MLRVFLFLPPWQSSLGHLICKSPNKIVIIFLSLGILFSWSHTWFECFIFNITQILNLHQNCEYPTGLLAFAYNHLQMNCHHSLNLSLDAPSCSHLTCQVFQYLKSFAKILHLFISDCKKKKMSVRICYLATHVKDLIRAPHHGSKP